MTGPRLTVVDPDTARRAAERILSDRRFRRDPAPRPLRGPLQWLGDRLSSIEDAVGRVLSPIPWWIWLAAATAVVVFVAARTLRAARARGSIDGEGGRRRAPRAAVTETADALEREADDAERSGDLDRAIRLRFRAGLLRLGDRGAITYRPSVTTTEVRRALGSETFDDLARTFEGVAYGGARAAGTDVERARRAWPRVLEEAARR